MRAWIPPRWELPSLPGVSQIRSVSATLSSVLESCWLALQSFVRWPLDAWVCLLPEERRRVALIALVSVCGLALLALSSAQRWAPR